MLVVSVIYQHSLKQLDKISMIIKYQHNWWRLTKDKGQKIEDNLHLISKK